MVFEALPEEVVFPLLFLVTYISCPLELVTVLVHPSLFFDLEHYYYLKFEHYTATSGSEDAPALYALAPTAPPVFGDIPEFSPLHVQEPSGFDAQSPGPPLPSRS